MEDADIRILIPGQKYLIKCKIDDNNWGVLECEFIKYYDNQYLDAFLKYHNELREFHEENIDAPQAVLPDELAGTVMEDPNNIKRPDNFVNELYPYYRYKINEYITPYIGLFRFIQIRYLVNNGKTLVYEGVYVGENPDDTRRRVTDGKFSGNNRMFSIFNRNLFINTGPLVNDVTLMWVYLDKSNLSIRPKFDKVKALQEKAVDAYKFLPEGVSRKIKENLGGKRKTRNKSRKQITKGKKHHSKSRKTKRRK